MRLTLCQTGHVVFFEIYPSVALFDFLRQFKNRGCTKVLGRFALLGEWKFGNLYTRSSPDSVTHPARQG
jgi:hypothetical protein